MIYRFGIFELDSTVFELRKSGVPVAIEPQVFNLLLFLINSRDRVVSRSDVIDEIWGGRIVSEATLSTCINAVRRAVDDDGKRQDVIRTVPRRGFRFAAPVTAIDDATLPGEEARSEATAKGPRAHGTAPQ